MTDTSPETAISPLSGATATRLFSATVLGRYPAHYFFDETTGFIFVDRPHWLEEAYSNAIAATDTGVLQRNLRNIDIIAQVLDRADAHAVRGVDLGGGYGLFVRGMRDRGFDFRWSDAYAENLMARGFEASPGVHDIAVAFEVLEHVPDPLQFLQTQRRTFGFRTCFFSATCFDPAAPPGRDWWYWAFETGQHISFFSRKTLAWIAQELDMTVSPITSDVFALSDRPWPRLRHDMWTRFADRIGRRRRRDAHARGASLTQRDHEVMRDRLRRQASDL